MIRHKGIALLAPIGLLLSGCDDPNELGWRIIQKDDNGTMLLYMFNISSLGEDKYFTIRFDGEDSTGSASATLYGTINCKTRSVKYNKFIINEHLKDGYNNTREQTINDSYFVPLPDNKVGEQINGYIC